MNSTAKQKEKEEQEQLANDGVPGMVNGTLAKGQSKDNGTNQPAENKKRSNPSRDKTKETVSAQPDALSKRPGSGHDVKVIRIPGMTWHQAGKNVYNTNYFNQQTRVCCLIIPRLNESNCKVSVIMVTSDFNLLIQNL